MRGLIGMIAAGVLMLPLGALACEGPVAVCDGAGDGMALIHDGQPATVYVDVAAEKPVLRVAEDFADDLERVSGKRPAVVHSLDGVTGDVVVIGEAGQVAGLADGKAISGRWEAFQQSVVSLPGGRHALVILGADKRGAIYGTYDISEKMGVSPWYWWADVPVAHKSEIHVTAGERHDAPVVKYRGFFLNDEEPSLGGWAREKFGGLNHQFYAKVFELDLRLKGNYLWPAMWGKSIADDDPESLDTADAYGIVLGTSHHEPMTRAQEEWHRHTEGGVTGGPWDYTKNADNLRAFWRGGIERMVQGKHENIVTVGMRGDGDEPMTEGTATQLLETIVADQRRIIAAVTGKPASETPQVWALYKEVQDYYDHGMTVPDDVTLLFSDDNWGQIRRLPDAKTASRSGGAGIYYHFDYVGAPRNYKWINTNQIEKVWQQMELAHESGADRLWIVNVGDLKPMEFPLSFYMDMAWNPDAMTPDALAAYPAKWAGQQFGAEHAQEIGQVLTSYSGLASRRKPELLDPIDVDIGSLGGGEYSYVQRWANDIAQQADSARAKLTPGQQTAFGEVVGYEASALANLYNLYAWTALARSDYALTGSPDEDAVNEANAAFKRDAELTVTYNHLANGKWDHMMDQTHIGYTGWQQPDANVMPSLTPPVEGSSDRGCGTPYPSNDLSIGRSFANLPIFKLAADAPRKIDGSGVRWLTIPALGQGASVITYPQTAPVTSVSDGVRLEFDFTLEADAETNAEPVITVHLAPTLDTRGQGGLRLAVAIDDQPAQTLTFDLKPDTPQWNTAVCDNRLALQARFKPLKAGTHTIKVFRIDGNVILEDLIFDPGLSAHSVPSRDDSVH